MYTCTLKRDRLGTDSRVWTLRFSDVSETPSPSSGCADSLAAPTPSHPDTAICRKKKIHWFLSPRKLQDSYTHSCLISGLDGGKWWASCPGYFTPGQEAQYQLHMRLGGDRIRYQGLGEEKNLLTLPRTLQPVAGIPSTTQWLLNNPWSPLTWC
jgi:hypothetical protein